MKNQALFSSKDKSKKLKCRLLQFLFGASRVNAATNDINKDTRFWLLLYCCFTSTVNIYGHVGTVS